MSTRKLSAGGLRSSFSYYYHRFPGYLQAKRERAASKVKKARWQLEDAWQRTIHPFEPLTGKTREEMKRILFRDPNDSNSPTDHHVTAGLVKQYKGFNIFALEGRYFGVDGRHAELKLESLRANEYQPCLVGHTMPDVEQDIDQFLKASDETSRGIRTDHKERLLFISNVPPEHAPAFLGRLKQYDITVLVTRGAQSDWHGYPTIQYLDGGGAESSAIDVNNTSAELLESLRAQNFDLVVAPFAGRSYWNNFNLEMFVPAFANRLVAMFEDGRTRSYKGEDLNRITYNKAYLNDMFRFVPPVKGKRILEVGCSDGLACDLLLSEDPDAVIGVDFMEAVGCNYRDPKISYFKMDASNLRFKDNAFDVCYSLATLEHVNDPFAVMQEMKRVTRPGGYCVIQAGPLYHSPFGHHMFGYFDDFPWIHLRLSKDEIVRYAAEHGADAKIRESHGISAAEYVDRMLRPEHINGLTVRQYRLEEFMALPDVKVLNLAKNYEGEDLLAGDLARELSAYNKEDLITSGFELIVKVK